jgi:hypothetical protein
MQKKSLSKISHMGTFKAGVEAGKGLIGEETVNPQHGTGVEENLHPCT